MTEAESCWQQQQSVRGTAVAQWSHLTDDDHLVWCDYRSLGWWQGVDHTSIGSHAPNSVWIQYTLHTHSVDTKGTAALTCSCHWHPASNASSAGQHDSLPLPVHLDTGQVFPPTKGLNNYNHNYMYPVPMAISSTSWTKPLYFSKWGASWRLQLATGRIPHMISHLNTLLFINYFPTNKGLQCCGSIHIICVHHSSQWYRSLSYSHKYLTCT